MRTLLLLVVVLLISGQLNAQKIDSIRFRLYTDSLKRGSYNYINVEGLYHGGRWLPLDTAQLIFTTSSGTLYGCSIWIPWESRQGKLDVQATLKQDTSQQLFAILYIKTVDDTSGLKTMEDVLQTPTSTKKKRRRRG